MSAAMHGSRSVAPQALKATLKAMKTLAAASADEAAQAFLAAARRYNLPGRVAHATAEIIRSLGNVDVDEAAEKLASLITPRAKSQRERIEPREAVKRVRTAMSKLTAPQAPRVKPLNHKA